MTPDGIQVCSPASSNSPDPWPLGSPWLEFLNLLPSDVFKQICEYRNQFPFPSLFKEPDRLAYTIRDSVHIFKQYEVVSQPPETFASKEVLGIIVPKYLEQDLGAASLRFSYDISNNLLFDLFCLSNNFIHRSWATKVMKSTAFNTPTSLRCLLSMRSIAADTLVGCFFANAMETENFDLLEMMLDEGADPTLLKDQRQILKFTAKHRNIEVANRLTDAIFSHLTHYCTKETWEATLKLAYDAGQISLLSRIIQAGMPIQDFDLALSIFSAIMDGKVSATRLFFQNGVDVNFHVRFSQAISMESSHDYAVSLLGLAAERGDIEMMCMLLNAGADIDGPHDSLYCPLILALQYKHYSAAEILVQAGADVSLAEAKQFELSKLVSWSTRDDECLIDYLRLDGQSCLYLLNTLLSNGAKCPYIATMKAVESNNAEFALAILHRLGAFEEEPGDLGHDAIHYAIILEKKELVWRFHLAGLPLAKAVRWIPSEEMLDFLESLGIISDIPCATWAGIIGAARILEKQTLAQRLMLLNTSSCTDPPLPTFPLPEMASWQREMEYLRQDILQGLPSSESVLRVAGWSTEAFTSPMLDIADPVVPIMGLFLVHAHNLSLPAAAHVVGDGPLHSIGLLLDAGGDAITTRTHLSEDYNLHQWLEDETIEDRFTAGEGWCKQRAMTGKCHCRSNFWLTCGSHNEKSVLVSIAIWGSLPLFQTFLSSFKWSSQDIGKSLAAVLDSRRNRSAIQELFALHPDPNAIYKGDTILESAARHAKVSIVRNLLRIGASAQSIVFALQRAAYCGRLELINMLLEAGADVNCPARKGAATALQSVADLGLVRIASQLIDAGADINALAYGKYGRTALQRAASNGRIDMLHMLLCRGARIYDDAPNQGYRANYVRAVRMAEKNGYKAAAKLLKSHGGWTDEDGILYSQIYEWVIDLACIDDDETLEQY
ncbi:ankyrin repeat-containing domain protein [Trichoderma sp. SZMC 28012]